MTRGKQITLALISLIVLSLLIIGVSWGQDFLLLINPKSVHTSFMIKKTKESVVSSAEVAEKAVVLLEKKQTPETLKVAKEAVNKLTKANEKSSLLARISVVEAIIQNKELEAEAERAVTYLEEHPDLSNIVLAQELLLKLTNQDIKKTLEERVRLVQESIDSQRSLLTQNEIETRVVAYTGSTASNSTPVQPSIPSAPVITQTQPIPPQLAPSTPAIEVPESSNPLVSGELPPSNPEPIAPPFPLLEP